MRLMTNCLTIFYATPDTYYIHYFLQNAINITPFETAHTTYRFLFVPQHSITITFLFECYLGWVALEWACSKNGHPLVLANLSMGEW